jgi:hypothetical protein
MCAKERELFELLPRRDAGEDPGEEPGTPAPDEPVRPVFSGGVVQPGHVVLSRRAVLAVIVAVIVLCIVSGLIGFALAG